MARTVRILAASLLGIFIIAVPSLHATWTDGGIPVCTAPGPQHMPAMTSDGAGGTIITWFDIRDAHTDIFAQRIDASGAIMWGGGGVPVCTASNNQLDPKIASDGAGGAIITWEDRRSNQDIYAQRIDGSGTVLWASNGIPVCSQADGQRDPLIVSDGAGGAIIIWIDDRDFFFDLFAQRLDASGTVLWTTDGVVIRSASGDASDPQITTDCAGGALIAWYDERNGNYDIFAQRINGEGTVLWTVNGVPVCTAPGNQQNAGVAHDGNCGAIVSWYDETGEWGEVYAQRLDYSGSAQWGAGGIIVCTYEESKSFPSIASDGDGGAIVVWYEYRVSSSDIYGQHLGPSGTLEWGSDGLPVCSAPGLQLFPQVVPDGQGGALVTGEDWTGVEGNGIFAQRVSGDGTRLWTANGIMVCEAPDDQANPVIIEDCAGGAIVAWEDSRSGLQKVYAQQIDSKGRAGRIDPVIHSAGDIPGDEGGYVTVAWDASPLDYHMGEITEYTVWRAIEAAAAPGMIECGAVVVTEAGGAPAVASSAGGRVVLLLSALSGESYYWELAASQDAYHLEEYSRVVPTLFDSTAVSDRYHYFQVVAHTDDPMVFYVSEPDSGYSVDNLAPGAPLMLSGEQKYDPAGLLLTWSPNTEPDLAHYNVYRGSYSGFEPGPCYLIGSPPDTTTFDNGWSWEPGYWYKVSAVDVHGNESPFAVFGPDAVTGDDTMPLPDATFLSQNWPNPFNPFTRICFGLADQSHVSLSIYDVSGRLIRVLVDAPYQAGNHEEIWDGRDDSGRVIASGVYFYRFVAGDFVQTRKMMLLK